MTAAAPPLTPAARRISLIAVLASAGCVGLVIGMTAPLMALFLERRGFSEGFIGLNAAVYSATLLVFGPMVPRLAARLGLANAILLGLIASAFILFTFPHVEAVLLLFVLRAALGASTAVDWVLSETWINLLAAESSRGRILSVYATVWGGGMALGPLLLGLVGTTGSAPFLLAALLLAVACVPIALSRRIAPPMPDRDHGGRVAEVVAAAPVAVAAAFLCGYGEGTVLTLFPVYGLSQGFSEARIVGLASVFAFGALAFQPLAGWLVDTLRGGVLVLGVTLLALATTAVVPFAIDHPAAAWILMGLWGGAMGSFYTIGLTMAVRGVPPRAVAAANTAFIMAYTLGLVSGPPLGGQAMQHIGADALFLAIGLPFVLLLPLILRELVGRGGRRGGL